MMREPLYKPYVGSIDFVGSNLVRFTSDGGSTNVDGKLVKNPKPHFFDCYFTLEEMKIVSMKYKAMAELLEVAAKSLASECAVGGGE